MDGTTAIKIDYYEELKAKADKYDEKETPLKVIVDGIYDCFSEESHEEYRCPKCNSCSFPDENYCSNCAQRLDWSDL